MTDSSNIFPLRSPEHAARAAQFQADSEALQAELDKVLEGKRGDLVISALGSVLCTVCYEAIENGQRRVVSRLMSELTEAIMEELAAHEATQK